MRIGLDPIFLLSLSSQRSEEHTSELQSQSNLVCRLLLEKKNIHAHDLLRMLARLVRTSSITGNDMGSTRLPSLLASRGVAVHLRGSYGDMCSWLPRFIPS